MPEGRGVTRLKLYLILAAAVAVAALGAVAWHAHAKSAFGKERFEAGIQSERLKWQETQRKAELRRSEERRRQQAEIDQFAKDAIEREVALEDRNNELEQDLAEARAAGSVCALPSGMFRQHRQID